MKDDLSQKNTRKYDIFFKLSEKMIFPKRGALALDLYCLIWKDGTFSPKTWYFFPGQKVRGGLSQEMQKVRGGLSQEIHGNITFFVYTYWCYKRGAAPLRKNKIKDGPISQKYT